MIAGLFSTVHERDTIREGVGGGICRRAHLETKADHVWLIQCLQNHAVGPDLKECPTQEGQVSHQVSVQLSIRERNECKAALQTEVRISA